MRLRKLITLIALALSLGMVLSLAPFAFTSGAFAQSAAHTTAKRAASQAVKAQVPPSYGRGMSRLNRLGGINQGNTFNRLAGLNALNRRNLLNESNMLNRLSEMNTLTQRNLLHESNMLNRLSGMNTLTQRNMLNEGNQVSRIARLNDLTFAQSVAQSPTRKAAQSISSMMKPPTSLIMAKKVKIELEQKINRLNIVVAPRLTQKINKLNVIVPHSTMNTYHQAIAMKTYRQAIAMPMMRIHRRAVALPMQSRWTPRSGLVIKSLTVNIGRYNLTINVSINRSIIAGAIDRSTLAGPLNRSIIAGAINARHGRKY